MDIWHWWLAKLAIAQIIYLFAVIWGMRYLNRWRLSRIQIRTAGRNKPAPTATSVLPAPLQKS